MNPADQPPPDPDRGDPVRSMTAWVLFLAAGLCVLAASILTGRHYGWVPPSCVFAAAVVFAVAGFAVLAGKGRRQ